MRRADNRLVIWMLPLALAAGAVFINDHRVITYSAVLPPIETEVAAVAKLSPSTGSGQAPPELSAHAFISAYLAPTGQIEVLAEKNAHQRWPIASITKLFTAAVAVSNYDLNQVVTLTKEDLPETDDSGFFRLGESFIARDLLLPLLINSSNNAAVILSRLDVQGKFVQKINELAAKLDLTDTRIFNPNGLDPVQSLALNTNGANYSSVYDLTLLAKWLLANRPELLALTRLPAATLNQANGSFHHQAVSTDELLTSEPWSSQIVGGKTGSTDLAGKNLLLILKAPGSGAGGYLINIILGSSDHFQDMRQLVGWVIQSYQF